MASLEKENYISSKTIKKSKPIPINSKKTNLNLDDEAYHVTSSIFNPNNFSPPDYWKIRLENRLAKLSCDSTIFLKVEVTE